MAKNSDELGRVVCKGYDFAITLNSRSLPNGASATSCAENFANIRKIILGIPLQQAFRRLSKPIQNEVINCRDFSKSNNGSYHNISDEQLCQQEGCIDFFVIEIADKGEKILYKGENCENVASGISNINSNRCMVTCYNDRVTVIFSVDFHDQIEKALAVLHLKKIAELARNGNLTKNSPICEYRRCPEPPRELKIHFPNENDLLSSDTLNDNITGYISFTFLSRHVETDQQIRDAEECIIHFLTNIEFEVKRDKMCMHQRLRQESNFFLDILTT